MLPAAVVCGVAFAGTRFAVSNFLNAQLTDDDCPRAPAALNAPATCTINVVFTPTTAGPAVGEVRVSYAPNKVATAQAKGSGV